MTSELDKYLGPKRPATVAQRKPTSWPDAPAHLRPLLDRFELLTGWSFKTNRKWYIKMAHDYYEEVKTSDPDLLKQAYRELEQRGMTLSSVKSCMRTAKWHNRKREDFDSEEARQEYEKGWTFDEEKD